MWWALWDALKQGLCLFWTPLGTSSWAQGSMPQCPGTLTLLCLGPLGEVITQDSGRDEEGPFTTSPPLAPPHSCLAFIWQNGAYQSHQLNKHTNPRLVRKNTQPELFISCSQALHTAHCQKHRRGPEAGQWGLSSLLWRWRVASPTPASAASLLPSLSLAHHQWVDISELLPTQNPPVSAFSLGTMGQLVACGTAEGQGWYWLTQGRQVPLHLLSRPAQPILDTVTGSPVCYGHIPWGLFLLQPLILAGMEARMAAPASVSGQSGPGWEKGKKAPPCTHFTEPGAPTTSFRKGTRTKGLPPPSLDPTQDNSIVF